MDEKEIKITEVIAHDLFHTNNPATNTASAWRGDPDVREDYRDKAGKLLNTLASAGIRVSVKSSKQLDDTVEQIITEPAVKAYTLEDGDAHPAALS